MAQQKIQVRKDSYDSKQQGATIVFEGRPQVRSKDQGIEANQMISLMDQSDDSSGNDDHFNMIHKRRYGMVAADVGLMTDAYNADGSETAGEYGTGNGNAPDEQTTFDEGCIGGDATGKGAGIRARGTNNGGMGNFANCKNSGPSGVWNFAGSSSPPLPSKKRSKF